MKVLLVESTESNTFVGLLFEKLLQEMDGLKDEIRNKEVCKGHGSELIAKWLKEKQRRGEGGSNKELKKGESSK